MSRNNTRNNTRNNIRNNTRHHNKRQQTYTREEQYNRNYEWVIRNISENLKRGSYRNLSILQEDLEKIQNNEFCQSNTFEKDIKQVNEIKTENKKDLITSDDVLVSSVKKSNKDEVFLPINKMLKYNNYNERREPQTLNHSKKQFKSISKTQTIQIKAGDNLEKMYTFKAFSHIDLSKTGEKDQFVFNLLFLLSNLYKLLSGRERRDYRSHLYKKIVFDYDSKDLHRKFGYNTRRINVNSVKSAMMKQAPLDLLGQILILDYFKVNVLIYKPDKKTFFTYLQYNKKYVNVFIRYQHNIYVPMEMEMKQDAETNLNTEYDNEDEDEDSDAFYSYKMIKYMVDEGVINLDESRVINPFTSHKLKAFSAYKLPELRDIADNLSIELTKFVNDKEKKKTKRDLYDEIKSLYTL